MPLAPNLVNAIAPGFIESRMTADLSEETKTILLERTPLSRFDALEGIAGAVALLIGPEGGNLGGRVLMAEGRLFTP